MSLDNPDVVDAIGIDRESGAAILTIADSWDWSDERPHLLALQEKLNRYFGFIESGEIFDSYPKAQERQLVIDIIGRYPLPESTKEFVEHAKACAAMLQTEIRFKNVP